MNRRLRERLEAMERAAEAKTGASVWFPGEDKPADWDTADIQVRFPDASKPRETAAGGDE
jgi:hypothetical protein